jgi:mRNA-degrading endonuclease RelE of RelBE toxin-antitoxin system
MPAEYRVELGPVAEQAFSALPKSSKEQVVKQLEKLKRAPQLGEPLGNVMGYRLSGYRKLTAVRKSIRIIYEILEDRLLVDVIAIGPREGARVYAIADAEAQRRRRLRRIS